MSADCTGIDCHATGVDSKPDWSRPLFSF
ncbi:CxxxxCH/CxxCH domain-containing protein [Collinsella aerofaciens]